MLKRIALAAVSAGAMVLVGCGSTEEAADRPAQDQYDQAAAAFDQGQLGQAISTIDAAATLPDVSPEMSSEIHSLQGQLHTAQARQLMDQAEALELNASRILSELRLAVIRVDQIQSQLKSDASYDPAPTIQALQAKVAQAQGGDGQNTWNGDELLTLAGIDAQSAKLQQQISDNRTQAQALTSQKTALAEQADKLQQQSLSDTDGQSVDDVKQAADLRRQAAEAGIEAEKLNAAVVHMQADLAGVQGQRSGVQQAIDGFNHQISDLGVAWRSVQQDMETQTRAIASIVGPGDQAAAPAPADETANLPLPTTIADQCGQLKTLIVDVRALRDQAGAELNKAKLAFTAAALAGDQVRAELSQNGIDSDKTPPLEKSAMQRLQETFAGSAGRLAAADAERTAALNYSSEVMIAIQANQSLSAAQAALGSQAPAAVADCLAAIASPSVDDLSQSAEDQFKSAMDHYDSVMIQTMPGPAAQSRKVAAMVGKMITVFGAEQLSAALSDKPVAGQSPKELQGVIDDLATQVAGIDPTRLPAIPYTIAVAPPAQ